MVASISAMQLRASIGDVLNRIQYRGERVVVERKGEPVAAIIGVADLQRLETLEAERELELVAMAKELLAREGSVPYSTLLDQYTALYGESLELPEHV
jgi:prevent-host-death family protein